MILRPRPTAWQLLYILRGSVLPLVLPQVLGISLLSCLAVLSIRDGWLHLPSSTAVPMSLLGLTLSIFLGFRNNASYDRWWEARKHWGALIIELRALARDAVALLDDGADPGTPVRGRHYARRLVHHGIAFAHAFAGYLRGHDEGDNLARYLAPNELTRIQASINPPDALLREMAQELASLRRTGRLTDIAWQTLNERVGGLASVLAACERIRFTPPALRLHRAPAPHRLPVLPAAALRAGGAARVAGTGARHRPGLYLLRAGCAGRRAGEPLRPRAQRTAAAGHGPDRGTRTARGPG